MIRILKYIDEALDRKVKQMCLQDMKRMCYKGKRKDFEEVIMKQRKMTKVGNEVYVDEVGNVFIIED